MDDVTVMMERIKTGEYMQLEVDDVEGVAMVESSATSKLVSRVVHR